MYPGLRWSLLRLELPAVPDALPPVDAEIKTIKLDSTVMQKIKNELIGLTVQSWSTSGKCDAKCANYTRM